MMDDDEYIMVAAYISLSPHKDINDENVMMTMDNKE